jgi:hypothetical protein
MDGHAFVLYAPIFCLGIDFFILFFGLSEREIEFKKVSHGMNCPSSSFAFCVPIRESIRKTQAACGRDARSPCRRWEMFPEFPRNAKAIWEKTKHRYPYKR